MRWVHKHLKTINGILVLTVMCGLFFSVTSPTQGFIVGSRIIKEEGILLHSIDKPQWRIGYNFTADCPAAFRQQEEELQVVIVKALQTWLQPLRARYPHRRFTDDFRLVRQPDVEKCGDDRLLLDELDARITSDCQGKGSSFALIAGLGTAPEVCMKEGGKGIDRSFTYTLVHELGHAFGLGDTYVRGQLVSSGGLAHTMGKQPAAVMSGDFVPLSPFQLGEDDKNGIIWVYKYLYENHPPGDCFFADYIPDEVPDGWEGSCRPKYPLIFEAKHGLPTTVMQILHDDPTLELNARDHTGMTALHYAVQRADGEIVKALLAQADIKVNISNKDGRTPTQLAKQLRFFRLAVMIEKHPTAKLPQLPPWTVERAWTLTTTWGALKRAR